MHTSPLAQPGSGDSGGMNVYVRELVTALAHGGVECDIYVRRSEHHDSDDIDVEPGVRVRYVTAGGPDLAKIELPAVVDEFTRAVGEALANDPVDVIHANYWLSGQAGHQLKHHFDIPLLSTFHTLARVKALTGDIEHPARAQAETEIIACSDTILASCAAEAAQLVDLYDADPDRIEIVAPGVDHAFFSPGDQAGARVALGLGKQPLALFVGRLQPLKGADVAVRTIAASKHTDTVLAIIGGPSGPDGERYVAELLALADDLRVADRLRLVEPQPHHILASWYRAADVCLVPSRSESFGLVALEAAASGLPVVASAVGGLTSIVRGGLTGYLVPDRDPAEFARHLDRLLGDSLLRTRVGTAAAQRALDFTWASAAARVRRVVTERSADALVAC